MRFSSAWVYLGLIFALYNWLIKGHSGSIDIILQCFFITFYFLSRVCELLEKIIASKE